MDAVAGRMASGDYAQTVNRHYGRSGIAEAILGGLRAMGKDLDALTPEDLAPADQFHTRGREATLELARLAGLARGMRVLDVGGGLGGPARTLATEIGCHVAVVDLTEEFCRAGAELTARLRLAGRVEFHHGSALDLPFGAAAFDAAWTQHSSMNIGDKERLYGEIARVLRPGGRLALHEIMAGPAQPIHFPVPWAREPSLSFLRSPDEINALLRARGLTPLEWRDTSAISLAWFHERQAAMRQQSGAPPPLGIHLLLGADMPVMFANLVRNLTEDRLAVYEGVWERPA
jgi:SAM-dependent methyltransferase